MSGRLFHAVKAGANRSPAGKRPRAAALQPYVDPVSSSSSSEEEPDNERAEDFETEDAEASTPRRRSGGLGVSQRGGRRQSGAKQQQKSKTKGGRHLRSDSRHGRILSPIPPNANLGVSHRFDGPFDLDFASMAQTERLANGRRIVRSPIRRGQAADLVKRRRAEMGEQAGRARDGIREFGRGIRGAFHRAFAKELDARGTKRKRGAVIRVMTPPDSRAGDDDSIVAFEESEVEDEGSDVASEADEEDEEEVGAAEEASVADMSVDGESRDSATQSEDEDEDANDDSFFLFTATQPQLNRLRRDRLVELAKLVLDGEDEEAEEEVESSTKETLIRRVIDARPPAGSPNRPRYRGQPSSPLSEATSVPVSSDAGSDVSDSEIEPPPRARRRLTAEKIESPLPRRSHIRTRSTSSRTSGASSPEVSRVRRNRLSLPHLSQLNLGGSSEVSLDGLPDGAARLRRSTRSNRGSVDMSKSLSESLSRPRTRSSILLVAEEEVEEGPEDDDDDVTPKIARRLTRQANGLRPRPPRRRVTFDSQSSALGGSSAGSLFDGSQGGGASESDGAEEETEEDDTGDVEMRDGGGPTPIARRTRHATSSRMQLMRQELGARDAVFAPRMTRSQSKTSQSSAFASDDEAGGPGAGVAALRRSTRAAATRRAPLQVATPPSEEQEEADGEEEEDEEEEEVVRSAHRSARKLRSGKVVRRVDSPVKEDDDDDDDDESAGDEETTVDGESVADTAEMASVGSDEEEEEDEGDGEVDLAGATTTTLLRLRRDNLVAMCEERDLETNGTKRDLAQNLLDWRENADSSFVPPSDDSGSDAESVTSGNTVHGDAGAVRAVRRIARVPSDCPTPLLLQSGHTEASDKPHTPTSQASSTQGEGAELDLESLNLQDREIAPGALKRLERIGSGGFKDVFRGVYKRVPVAIADFRGHLTEMDLKELRILRDLRHDNIVRFIGVSVPEDSTNVPVMIVTEICTNGDLFDYIRNVPAPPFEKMLSIMRDIAKGLDYLHTRTPAIIHRDLKSSNVLITARGVAKLNDFGLARIKNSTRSMIRSLVGTVNWQAPELWVPHPRYNEKVDVYSAGMVYWEMLQWHQTVKRYPFEGQNEHAIYHDAGQRQLRPATAGMRRQWGDPILDLVEKLWSQSPQDRPKMGDCIAEVERLLAAHKKPRSK